MKKYILLFINLFIIVNSFNYSLDDFDIVSKPVNDYSLDDFDIVSKPVNDYSLDDFDIVSTLVNDYSLDDFDVVSTQVNDYKIPYSSINEIDFNLPNIFIYNLVDFLI
jgi:hypothetical protein